MTSCQAAAEVMNSQSCNSSCNQLRAERHLLYLALPIAVGRLPVDLHAPAPAGAAAGACTAPC